MASPAGGDTAGPEFYSTASRRLFGTRRAAFRLSLRPAALPVKTM